MNPTAAILDSISELIVHHDPEMRVLWANKAVSDLVGLAPEELVGRYCYETWPRRSEPCVGCPVTKARETGQAQEEKMITPDGRAWFIRGYPVRDINGKLTGTVEIALEISERKRVESERLAQTLAITELLHRDLKLEQLLDQIAQGAVGLGFRRAVINVCEPDGELVRVQATAGLEKHERKMLMAATYHWSDFQSLMQERFRVSRSYLIRHGEVDWEKDFRGPVVIPSVENRGPGYWHPEDALFVPLWGLHGQPVRLLSVDEPASGLIPDLVTIQTLEAFANQAAIAIENARLFKQIEERRMYLEGVLKATPDAIVTVDAQDKIVEWNPGSERLFGYSREEAIGHSLNDLVTKPDVYEEGVRFSQILMAGNEVPPVETVRYRKDGSPVHVILAASPIVVREKLMGAVIVYTDITARKQMEDTLRALLLVDELTGLYNRRGFMTLGRQQLKTAHRLKTAVVMLFADFDNLKRINDTFGHPEGDRALIDVAEVLRMTFRESDIIARIGGDEFVVLALQVANESANAITTRLQKNLQAHNTTRHRRYKLSLSVGIAQYDPEHPCSIEELLVRADRAMYDRKREQPSAFDEASGQQRNGNAQPEAMPNNTLKEAK